MQYRRLLAQGGAGHTYESTMGRKAAQRFASSSYPLADIIPPEIPDGNWLKRLSLKKQWQTRTMQELQERTKCLEMKLLHKEACIQDQEKTILRLRARVCDAMGAECTVYLFPPT